MSNGAASASAAACGRRSRDGDAVYVDSARFTDREAFAIMAAMAEEFPGYRSHDLISRSGSIRNYAYVSTAKSYKLEEWLTSQLMNMGFDADRDVLIQGQGIKISIEKLVSSPSREAPAQRRRFR